MFAIYTTGICWRNGSWGHSELLDISYMIVLDEITTKKVVAEFFGTFLRWYLLVNIRWCSSDEEFFTESAGGGFRDEDGKAGSSEWVR